MDRCIKSAWLSGSYKVYFDFNQSGWQILEGLLMLNFISISSHMFDLSIVTGKNLM